MRAWRSSSTHLVLLCFLSFWVGALAGENPWRVWYLSPAYQRGDASGEVVAVTLGDALFELAEQESFPGFRRANEAIDTVFRRMLRENALARNAKGFLRTDSVRAVARAANAPAVKLLFVYDAKGQQDYLRWRAAVPFGAGIVGEVLSGPVMETYDSLWCRVSLVDLLGTEPTLHFRAFASSETCDGHPEECIVERIKSLLERSRGPQESQPFHPPPVTDQHWGKVGSGTGLLVLGALFGAVSLAVTDEIRPWVGAAGAAMAASGSVVLSIGIVKQAQHKEWTNRRQ